METVINSGLNKSGRIKDLFNRTVGKLSKSDIAKTYPDISTAMIEKVLGELVKNGKIEKVGKGPATAYVKKQEKFE